MASPLTRQARPSSFQPKVSHLYDELFKYEDDEVIHSEGFWLELFLLRPDKPSLQRRFESLTPDDLLHFQSETQQLFARAVGQIKAASAPGDENALDTLTVVLGVILAKRYTNPSADIIALLAGLDEVDAIFTDFANAIDNIIRVGRSVHLRQKAIQVALSLTSGAYQTSLVSYFTHRDLFPALMKYIQDTEVQQPVFEPFLLLGLLVNYNKFEFRNPYRLRLEDFVNETTIQKMVRGLGRICSQSRSHYVSPQEDVNEGWTLTNALAYIGLGILAPRRTVPTAAGHEDAKEKFAALPESDAAILLGTYDFTNANKLFCFSLVTCSPESQTEETPLAAFLSFTSYILHHAHRSSRATLYALLNLSTLRLTIEDPVLCKHLCNPDSPLTVRLCRQKPPFLPSAPNSRPAAASIFDILIDAINHNLRRRLDVSLYVACIRLIHRLLAYLVFTRTRFQYHWSLLWQTLLSLLRFLTTYAQDLLSLHPDIRSLLDPLLSCLALAVSAGDGFLPDLAAYDDFFYKLVEAGHYLPRFKQTFNLDTPATTSSAGNVNPGSSSISTGGAPITTTSPIDLLIQVSTHYHDLLETERSKGRIHGSNLSPREVGKVIRQGHDTLSLPPTDGLERWDRWREGDEKSMLKRVARVAVADTARLLRGP
ncbi:hypothetical protein MMC07_001804 [Pseudocyphellaria aurata]|nr:hypothetical protein [Pseudocyphellaria aurata]